MHAVNLTQLLCHELAHHTLLGKNVRRQLLAGKTYSQTKTYLETTSKYFSNVNYHTFIDKENKSRDNTQKNTSTTRKLGVIM